MTETTHEQIRDILPDALHGTLDGARRRQLEDHLHSCAECAAEMRVLEMVKNAPSFAPMIDAVRVASAVLPYGGVPGDRPSRVRTRSRGWQLALAVLVVAGAYLSLTQRGPAVVRPPKSIVALPVTSVSPAEPAAPVVSVPAPPVTVGRPKRELQLAAGLEDLSDGSIAQLARELDGLDGLPSPEPENLGVSDPNLGGEGVK